MTEVIQFLVRSGAPPDEALEFCKSLLTDLVVPKESRKPRLARYEGLSSIDTWLHSVALNGYVDRIRRKEREHAVMQTTVPPCASETDDELEPAWAMDPKAGEISDAPLLHLMIDAIESAFKSCTPEDFVLLQLSHCDGLLGKELAVMFRCHPAQISRRLELAQKEIAASVRQHIRQTDPWLDLKWEDFTELCRTSTPTCFGLG